MTASEDRGRGMTNPAPSFDILVLGVGNILLRDDGVGVHVVKAMQQMAIPANVELMDGGTAGADLVEYLNSRNKVIVIDAVRGGGEPGAVYRFTPADIRVRKDIHTSAHQIDLLEALAMAEFLGDAPKNVVIYGIEPHSLGWGLEISPEVAAVVPEVIELVLAELERL